VDEDPEAGRRRAGAAIAGHTGDVEGARALLADPVASVRATALGALARLGALDDATLAAALADADPDVRRRAATEAGRTPDGSGRARRPLGSTSPPRTEGDGEGEGEVDAALAERLADDDEDPLVAEAAAWALGERNATSAVPDLARAATAHDDALVREAAVAALGAIGDERGLPAILRATTDKPAVRRRAVLALAPFEGDEVEAALRRALEDRDWQVRQAAEDLLS
jgi:HEAT repeat protein